MLYLKLFRVDNWIKNLFILLPLFFSAQFFLIDKLIYALQACLAFSLVTSFVYIVNDIYDINFDKTHYEKKNRPLAAGKISVRNSLIIGFFSLFFGLIIMYYVNTVAFNLTLIYLGLNIFYSSKLKHIPIIDFIIISIGFVLRIFIGSEIGEINLTQWMILLVFLLSLFIAVSKRRDDVFLYEKMNKMNRSVVQEYSLEFIDKTISIISSVLIVAYLLFITSPEVYSRYNTDYIYFTFLPVLIGILRFNQLTYVYNKSGSPIKILFKDRFLQLVIILWIASYFIIIYGHKLL